MIKSKQFKKVINGVPMFFNLTTQKIDLLDGKVVISKRWYFGVVGDCTGRTSSDKDSIRRQIPYLVKAAKWA